MNSMFCHSKTLVIVADKKSYLFAYPNVNHSPTNHAAIKLCFQPFLCNKKPTQYRSTFSLFSGTLFKQTWKILIQTSCMRNRPRTPFRYLCGESNRFETSLAATLDLTFIATDWIQLIVWCTFPR